MIELRTFEKNASVTAETVYSTLIESLGSTQLKKMRSVIVDTSRMNTGKKKSINSRLAKYMDALDSQEIHVLECQLNIHVNEILLNHVIKLIDGKSVAPDRMHPDSLYNKIKLLRNRALTSRTLGSYYGVISRSRAS